MAEGPGRTYRLAGGGQLLEQERNGDLQQRLPEEALPHRAAVIVVLLPGKRGRGQGGLRQGAPPAPGRRMEGRWSDLNLGCARGWVAPPVGTAILVPAWD